MEQQGQAYVGMVACTEPIVLTLPDGSLRRIEVGALPALLPEPLSWQRLTTGTGPKGPRPFDWLCLSLWHCGHEDGKHFVLLRRFLEEPHRVTFALVFASEPTPLPHLVMVAGSRWHIEEDLQACKALGLGQYEVRSFVGWYRHVTLVLLAYAFLISLCQHVAHHPPDDLSSNSPPLISFTPPEIQHLLAHLISPVPTAALLIVKWSHFRRTHHYWAGYYHRRRRLK